VLRPLLEAETQSRHSSRGQPLIESVPGDAGGRIGEAVLQRLGIPPKISPAWEALYRSLLELNVLRERYPEVVARQEELIQALVSLDFILSISLSLRDYRAAAHWTMYSDQANRFARHLYGNKRLREEVARVVGLNLADFDELAPNALRAAHHLGQFPDLDAIALLKTGSFG
jgi:hypothetical protein